MKRLIVVGGGFAGFWSAASAVRQAKTLEKSDQLCVSLVTLTPNFSIRPRFYERDLSSVEVPLPDTCDALGVELVTEEVTSIDTENRTLGLRGQSDGMPFDSLVLAAGSRLKPFGGSGAEHGFNVDTLAAARILGSHLERMAQRSSAAKTAERIVVVGAGLTGLEVVTELPNRLGAGAGEKSKFEFVLVDQSTEFGLGYSAEARAYLRERLEQAGIRLLMGEKVEQIEAGRVILESGTIIETGTVIFTTGALASPLTAWLPGPKDENGRVLVDENLALPGGMGIFVAGDSAKALTDGEHYSLMSCQHAMPQGKFAGHNAVSQLFGAPLKAYAQPHYVTCLDLGHDTALFTRGWERKLELTGAKAKELKTQIMTERIYPPATIAEILEASSP